MPYCGYSNGKAGTGFVVRSNGYASISNDIRSVYLSGRIGSARRVLMIEIFQDRHRGTIYK
jgi:hypothetical protein